MQPLEGEVLGLGDLVDIRDTARNEQQVRANFWRKVQRVARRIPFANDVVAAYYCAIDTTTPARVRAILFAGLAYFVMPADLVPDIVAGVGFTDDATVLATLIGLVARHIRPEHRSAAATALDLPDPERR